jgi:hypothetical protein
MAASASTVNDRKHQYNAVAQVLSGQLHLPVAQQITPQTHASLPEEGGYFAQRAERYRLESVISMESSYTHLTGNRDTKPGHGWTTHTTSVIEGLNVLEIVTADRVVGQIITEHPEEGYVPRISFLGTRFDNLRIAGHPIVVDLNINALGPKPANDEHYVLGSEVAARVSGGFDHLKGLEALPDAVRGRYNQLSSTLGTPQEEVECSLVQGVTGTYPGETHGHVITIPDFGTVVLAKVTIKHEDYKQGTKTPKKTTVTLTMLDFHFGCLIAGEAAAAFGSTNGTTYP